MAGIIVGRRNNNGGMICNSSGVYTAKQIREYPIPIYQNDRFGAKPNQTPQKNKYANDPKIVDISERDTGGDRNGRG